MCQHEIIGPEQRSRWITESQYRVYIPCNLQQQYTVHYLVIKGHEYVVSSKLDKTHDWLNFPAMSYEKMRELSMYMLWFSYNIARQERN